jgi:Zn finger protein HypA/HybF involved in hydrogenase expression
MPKNLYIDHEFFKKVCESQEMSTPDLAALFQIANRTALKLQLELGIKPRTYLKCSICGQRRKVNCYSKKFPGVCVKCRFETGLEANYHHRGLRIAGDPDCVQTVRAKCHECHKPFLSRVTFDGKHAEYYCPVCKSGWHEYEDGGEVAVRLRGVM